MRTVDSEFIMKYRCTFYSAKNRSNKYVLSETNHVKVKDSLAHYYQYEHIDYYQKQDFKWLVDEGEFVRETSLIRKIL